jgi:hypothetical protein
LDVFEEGNPFPGFTSHLNQQEDHSAVGTTDEAAYAQDRGWKYGEGTTVYRKRVLAGGARLVFQAPPSPNPQMASKRRHNADIQQACMQDEVIEPSLSKAGPERALLICLVLTVCP